MFDIFSFDFSDTKLFLLQNLEMSSLQMLPYTG